MLNMLYDFIPVLLFFLAFKFYGIYVATGVGIVATGIQVLLTRMVKKQYDKKQWITFIVFLIFGGMTLYFHNPLFVKWKPTIIFWLFSLGLIFSKWVTPQKPLLARLFEGVQPVSIPLSVWHRLTYAWIIFFLLLGGLNIFIAYHFSTETWVNFKLYGILGAFLLFSVGQSVYLARYFSNPR